MAGARTLWKTFAVQAALMGIVVFVAVKAAVAREGVSSGPARTYLTVAGTLAGVDRTRATPAQFTLESARGFSCGPISVSIPAAVGASESFSVEVPIDECRSDLFDGANVTARIQVAGLNVSTVVNPVPYAHFADVAGSVAERDCPSGYVKNPPASTTTLTACTRTLVLGSTTLIDEVVKVGDGADAFWIDRFEASVWNPSGMQLAGVTGGGGYAPLAENGQWAAGSRNRLNSYAVAGVAPSRYLTWFQANALCRASGKHLVTRSEWFTAADGLVVFDPSMPVNGNTPGETRCNTGGTEPRQTGTGTACMSSWGAQDMIGNVAEWTDEWYASVGQSTSLEGAPTVIPATSATEGDRLRGVRVNSTLSPWGAASADDGTSNISSIVNNGAGNTSGVPAAMLRGGYWNDTMRAGVFYAHLGYGPLFRDGGTGFRCAISR